MALREALTALFMAFLLCLVTGAAAAQEEGGAEEEEGAGDTDGSGEAVPGAGKDPIDFNFDIADVAGDVAPGGNDPLGANADAGERSIDLTRCWSRFDGQFMIFSLSVAGSIVIDDPAVRYSFLLTVDPGMNRSDVVGFTDGTAYISGWGGYSVLNYTLDGEGGLTIMAPLEDLGELVELNLSAQGRHYLGNGTFLADFAPDSAGDEELSDLDVATDPSEQTPTNVSLNMRFDAGVAGVLEDVDLTSFIFDVTGTSSSADHVMIAYGVYVDDLMIVRSAFTTPPSLVPGHWGWSSLINGTSMWDEWTATGNITLNSQELLRTYQTLRGDDFVPGDLGGDGDGNDTGGDGGGVDDGDDDGGSDGGDDGGDDGGGDDGGGDDGGDGGGGNSTRGPGAAGTRAAMTVKVKFCLFIRGFADVGETQWDQVTVTASFYTSIYVPDTLNWNEAILELDREATVWVGDNNITLVMSQVVNNTAIITVGSAFDVEVALDTAVDVDSDGDGVMDVVVYLADINGTSAHVVLTHIEPPADVDDTGLPGSVIALAVIAVVVALACVAGVAYALRRKE